MGIATPRQAPPMPSLPTTGSAGHVLPMASQQERDVTCAAITSCQMRSRHQIAGGYLRICATFPNLWICNLSQLADRHAQLATAVQRCGWPLLGRTALIFLFVHWTFCFSFIFQIDAAALYVTTPHTNLNREWCLNQIPLCYLSVELRKVKFVRFSFRTVVCKSLRIISSVPQFDNSKK